MTASTGDFLELISVIPQSLKLRHCIPKMFVGNGLDRSGIGVFTAILNEIRIEYNTLRLEAEQASQFPTALFHISVHSTLN